jgi:hypothetical protein
VALRRRAQLQDDPGAGRLHCGGHTTRPPLIRLLRRNPLAAGRRRSRPGGSSGSARAAAGELAGALRQAFDAFDESAAQAILDRLVSDLSVTAVMREIVLPYLAELGDRWERGDASIAQQHFASNLIRGRLTGPARD